jgi:threonine dehydratase
VHGDPASAAAAGLSHHRGVTHEPLVDADLVEDAARRLSGVIARTPLERNERLSTRIDANVWLKREDLQVVRSYKVRGAYNVISQLDPVDQARGVVCASAGNHGQGVAYACAALGVKGVIYLPRNTPRQKRDRIATIGGSAVQMVVIGDTYDEAAHAAIAHAQQTGATLVPAFDAALTVAGQGTVAMEIVEQLGAAPDVMIIPVGGGGLLAGCATWLHERHPKVRIIGVEPAGAPTVAAALAAGHPVDLQDLDTFIDGAAVRRAGELTTPLIGRTSAELIQVDEGRVCVELLEMYQSEGIIAEPAGSLAAATLGQLAGVEPGATVVCILSGGNNDVSRYAEIIERALIYEGRKHYFLVEFPQEPGALRRFLDEVLGPDDDITLFEYVKRSNRDTGPALVGIELARAEDLQPLLERMRLAPPKIEQIPANSPLFRFLL